MYLIPRHAESLNLLNRGFHIRYATHADISACDAIARQYPKELAFVRKVSLQRGVENHSLHVAIIDNQVVGFVLYHRRRDDWQTIYDLAVHKNYSGIGIGRNLLYSVECPIRLKVKADNETAIRFYKNAGMQLEAEDTKLKTYVLHHLFIFCAGNNQMHPQIARQAGMGYGCQQFDTPRDWCFMTDVEFEEGKQDWQDYMHKVYQWKPLQAMVTDYQDKTERTRLYQQIRDLKEAGVMRIKVCPKFDGAIRHIPRFCVIALSIPTENEKFKGWLPLWQDMADLKGRRVHLLGGSPQYQVAEVDRVKLYGGRVISMDGNSFQRAATGSTAWVDGRWYRQASGEWEFGTYANTLIVSASNIVQYVNQPDTWLSGSTSLINKRRQAQRQMRLF